MVESYYGHEHNTHIHKITIAQHTGRHLAIAFSFSLYVYNTQHAHVIYEFLRRFE